MGGFGVCIVNYKCWGGVGMGMWMWGSVWWKMLWLGLVWLLVVLVDE